ncbi:MAG: DAK2 domain-containing protein [Ruminococcaceae bacterium]|nr:DAK2 domain-containing protein [Oscillospiraceae bacterium]
MQDTINGAMLREMLLFGAARVAANKQSINDLNVFPVPDGDTGTNMCLTIQTAATELKAKNPQTIDEVMKITANAMLRGARGNSGVILSLLFRGISKDLKGIESVDGAAFASAMQEGVAAAYNAVMKPAEGTILTVSRLAADAAMRAAGENNSVEYILEAALRQGEITLKDTVNMNPVLKRAGVVDAGGKGFLCILEGMLASLRGEEMPTVDEDAETREKADFAGLGDQDITFTFDTVFIVRKTRQCDLRPFREYLDSIGDSIVVSEGDDMFKVHVHTDTPGDALNMAQQYGTLEVAKIENMRIQQEDMAAGRKTISADQLEDEEAEDAPAPTPSEPEERKPFGFLAVCAGDGLAEVFRDMGVDGVISGGQTMNPSTESILKEIERTNADTVFVLPNNKNIVMAAQQCVGLTDREIVVIPTSTVPQGISAMMAVDLDCGDAKAIERAMLDAAKNVATAQITYAARDSDFDGNDIHEGDFLALLDGKLFGVDKSISVLLEKLADAANERGAEFVNVFYGEDVDEAEANVDAACFTEKLPNAEVSVLSGGQPVYYYIISFE